MQRIALTLALVMFVLTSYGQNKEVEELMNDAYTQVVPSDFYYYNLDESSFAIKFYDWSFRREGESFLKEYPDFPLDFFLKESEKAVVINWNDYHLRKAKTYSPKTRPKYLLGNGALFITLVPYTTPKHLVDSLVRVKPDVLIVPVKYRWNKKRRKKEIEKVSAKYDETIRKEDKICYWFSTPIISQNRLYAMVGLGTTYTGATHIFKKINGKWKEIFSYQPWVS